MDFFLAENRGQFVFGWRANNVEGRPVTLQRALKQKLDATEGDGEGAARELTFVAQVEEILA